MAGFDASVISEIGGNTPDVAGSQAKALTLADLYDTNALNKIKVSDARQGQSDMTYAKQILKGKDLSKLEDQNAAVAEITKRSPKLGMELARGFSTQQSDKANNDLDQLKLHAAKNDILGSEIQPLKDQHDQLIGNFLKANPKATPEQAEQSVDAAMRPQMFETLKRLRDARLPNGQPVLNDQDLAFAKQSFANGYNPQAVNTIISRSTQAKQEIALKMKEQDESRKDRQEDRKDIDSTRKDELEADRFRHERESEAIADRKTKIAEAKAAAAKSAFAGKPGDLMAALAERGISLPAGFRSKDQQLALLGSLWARNPGATADEIASKVESGALSFANAKTEGRAAAGVAGKVTYAEHELEQTIPLVREASQKLPRGEFIPFSKLQQMGEASFSDPNLAEFKMYMTSLSNAYDMLAARGGTDADKRRESRHNFDTAASPEALEGVLRAVQKEAGASGRAASESMQDAANRNNPKGPTAPTASSGGSGAAPTAVLRFDAKGNPIT